MPDSDPHAATGVDLRLWPGLAIVAVQWQAVFGAGLIAPATMVQFYGMLAGPALAAVLLFGWWLLASRAPWKLRLLGSFLPLAAFALVFVLTDATARMALVVYGLSIFSAVFVLWAALARRWTAPARRTAMIVAVIGSLGFWPFVRSDGVDGDMNVDFAWRWSETAEERFLASAADGVPRAERLDAAPEDEAVVPADAAAWPGFRGAARDGVVRGLRIATDWQASPPIEVWRRPVGPGWSSFAIAGDLLFTQEQRGEDEVVSAYRIADGETAWLHTDRVRFWESLAGAGPRATPTFDAGRLYSLGATGVLNALDAASGRRHWSRDLVADTGAAVPEWGFSASPLIIAGVVVVHAGGPGGKGVVAYDAATGEPRWFAEAGALSYSSVHLMTLDGMPQLVIITDQGARGLAPTDGAVLWSHAWPSPGNARIVQPVRVGDRGVLVGTGLTLGLRRLEVSRSAGGWQAEVRWTSTDLKPYYNDMVVHRGHVYGFDGRILACLDVETGERAWKGGRYGNGQLVLLPAQDLLLVLSDRGELALVAADPAGFSELARMPAIAGKTWNHPAIVGGVLYVRNGEEMAAFRLPTTGAVAAHALTMH